MSFRKRNAVLSGPPSSSQAPAEPETQLSPGLRLSPIDGRPVTSTGTQSLDALLAGQAGFALGKSILFEEKGTTDFSGVLLKYYAAEGLVQGHRVHVFGYGEGWKRELPGLADAASAAGQRPAAAAADDKMKIAWRYEALGNRDGKDASSASSTAVFCHPFDLRKRLASGSIKGTLHAAPLANLSLDELGEVPEELKLLHSFYREIYAELESSPPTSVHRIVIPNLLSPALYSSGVGNSQVMRRFFLGLRALLAKFPKKVTAMISMHTDLYPRHSGLVRWMERMCDGVIELAVLPARPMSTLGDELEDPDPIQGMVNVYKMPVYHDKVFPTAAELECFAGDRAFSLSASKGLVIKPYSLPPVEDTQSKGKSPASATKEGLDF